MKTTGGTALLAAAAGLALCATAQAQFTIVNNIPGTFVDISSTGAFLGGGDDASFAQVVAAAISNSAFPPGTLQICTNGGLGYNADNTFTNAAIPSAAYHGGGTALAPFWDDLITVVGSAGIYTQVIGSTLYIQWQTMDAYPGSPTQGTFQVQIFGGGSGPSGAQAQMLYQSVLFGTANDNGASATIGYQASAAAGIQYSFDTASIQNGVVLSLMYTGPSGACCAPSGSCGISSGVACTGGGGIYRGDGSVCATANCPQPCPPITGTMPNGPSVGWPSTHGTQNTRLFRDGVPDTCALSASGGAPIAGSFAYDKYDFSNTSASPVCVSVDITTACTGTNFIYAGAYVGAYDPNNPLTNNVASCGGSPNPTANMSFNVPGNTAFSIVFAEVTPGAGCPSYDFRLSGGSLSCNPSGPTCYANCDASTNPPALNVLDFNCFLNKFAANDTYANCDQSTNPPVLNVLDFNCFLNKFAAGCS